MLEEILVGIGMIAIFLLLVVIKKKSEKNEKIWMYFLFIFAIILIMAIAVGIVALLKKPTLMTVSWIVPTGFFSAWCIFDGIMILKGKTKLLERILKRKKRLEGI